MDWPTIKVLTHYLRELLDELAEAKQVKTEHGTRPGVRDEWYTGIESTTVKLMEALGLENHFDAIHSEQKSFAWFPHQPNAYFSKANSLILVAERLIRDYDAETGKASRSSVDEN